MIYQREGRHINKVKKQSVAVDTHSPETNGRSGDQTMDETEGRGSRGRREKCSRRKQGGNGSDGRRRGVNDIADDCSTVTFVLHLEYYTTCNDLTTSGSGNPRTN